MSLPDINLDDRRFEELFNDARRRIPAYTPEWTDHNDSDPGITFLQLAAYLQEILIWRLNRVPQKNFQKFLQLVGLDLLPAATAHADLTFTLGKGAQVVDVPASAQAVMGGGSGQPVIFETDAALAVVGLSLVAVQSFDGSRFTLQTDANAVNGPPGFFALSATPQRNAALYLGFDAAFPLTPDAPDRQYRITIYGGGADVPAPAIGGTDPLAAISPPVQAYWEYWAGDTSQWRRVAIVSDTTFALSRSGAVLFTAPADAQARKLGMLMKPDDKALFWFRFRIDSVIGPGYETPPRLDNIVLNTVPATNASTEQDVLLGAANGRPNQTFQLPRFPVLPNDPSVPGIIAVDEGSGFETWTEVGDFAASGPQDMHYVLNHATGAGQFGDGKQGKIPRWLSGNGSNRDDADIVNIKASSFRWGGGLAGNSGPETITGLRTPIPFVASVTNRRASFGGADEESVADAEIRAPMALRTANRAVTGDDFAFLAMQTPGAQIARAMAFPLLNPSFRVKRSAVDGSAQAEVPVPGAITVVVVPQSTQPQPMPTEGTLSLIAQWLDKHRMLTAELFVVGPRYREVSIEARVIARPTAALGSVQDALNKTLLAFFHPLTGGSSGTGWDFGGTIYFSEIYRAVLETEGVLRIPSGALKTFLDGKPQASGTDVLLEPDELVFSQAHHVTVSYA